MLLVSSFYRICFWSIGGSCETPAYYFFISVKTMTAPTVWQSCLRILYDGLALLRNKCGCAVGLVVSKLPRPTTQPHSYVVSKPSYSSCSAQTLRRVSSLVVLVHRLVRLSIRYTRDYNTCFCKGNRRQS